MTTRTEQAKEELLASIRAFADRIERDARQGVYGEAGFPAIAVRGCVDDLIAAVVADQDAQTRQAFEAGWDARCGWETRPVTQADAYAAYLAAPPAQKGTP